MKSVFLTLAILASSSFAMADKASDLFAVQKSATMNMSSVLGVWEIGPFVDGENTFTIRMRIEQNQVTAANKCTKGANVAMVALTIASALTPDTLTMMASDSNAVVQNGVNCSMTVKAGTAEHYTVANGVMNVEDSPLPANKISD